MTTLMNLAAAALIGIVILFLIIAVVFLSLSNDVPRVGGMEGDSKKPAKLSKYRGVLTLLLIAALIGIIIHYLWRR